MDVKSNRIIAVGFGTALVTCDGHVVYDEDKVDSVDDYWTFERATEAAKKRPECCWEIFLRAPLWDEVWQFDGEKWILIKSSKGFA